MAVVDLELNAKNVNTSLNSLKSGFKALAGLAAAAASAFAVKKITEAASQQEQAVRSLNTALALTGDFTAETSKNFQDFASELQKNSTVGDEVTLSLVGLTKSMGATNEQSKQIIETAVNLSAVTGESLETSVRNLTKTLGGMKGELGETQPELRNLTKEQLQAGEGIDILSKKYAGTAKELTKTFGGALTQTSNSFGDLLEEVGFLITQNPIVIKAINATSKAFNDLGSFIKENRESVIDFTIDAITSLIDGLGFLIDRVGDAVAIFSNFDAVIDLLILTFADLSVAGVTTASDIVKGFKGVLNLGISPLVTAFGSVAEALNTLGIVSDESLGLFKAALESLTLDSNSGLDALVKQVTDFRNAAREGFLESSDQLMETKDGFTSASDSVRSFADSLRALKSAGDDANKALQDLSDANEKARKSASKPFAERTFFGGITGANIQSGAAQALGAVTKGAAGANELLTAGATAAGTAFLGPAGGQAAGALVGLLGQGPEAVKAQVDAFVEQLPVLIDALVEALPVFVEALAGQADKIIIAVASKADDIAIAVAKSVIVVLPPALGKALARVVKEFAEEAKEAIGNLTKDLGKGVKDIFNEMFKGLLILPSRINEGLKSVLEKITPKLFEAVAGGLTKVFDKLLETYTKIGESILDGVKNIFNGLIESIKNIFDIDVPGAKGGFFNNPEEATKAFIDNPLGAFGLVGQGSSSQPTRIVLQIGERQLAEVILDLNRNGFRTA